MDSAGPSTDALISTAEPHEENNMTPGPPTLTRNRSFKSKQLVRSQAIRESQSPPRLPSPLPPISQSENNSKAPLIQSTSDNNLNERGAVTDLRTVLSATSLRSSDSNNFNVTDKSSSKNNPSSLNENISDRIASQCKVEVEAREGGGGRNKQRGRRGDRGGEGKQRRDGKECQQVEIQITSGNWELGSPIRNRSPKNRDRDNQERHSRTQAQRRWLSTKQSSQDLGWRSLEEESWRNSCVCGSCGQDKDCLWNKWRICPDCRGRKYQPRCPAKQDSGVVCSDDCSDCSELTSPEIVLTSANSEPILATDRRRGKDSDKYPEDGYFTICRCQERNDKLSNNNNSINSNKNTPALLKHLVQDEMDNRSSELSGPSLVQFIKDTLNKSIKDRISLLRIEKELIALVHDTGRTQQKFPSMTSYGRMLVHRCARLFCLQHKLEPMAKEAVIVTKIGTFGGRIPCTPFEKWCSVQFPDAPGKLHQDMTQAKSILKRSAHSLDESEAEAGSVSRGSGSASARSKSFEQREEEYERVRRRIFSGDETRGSTEDDFNWLQQSEENISSAGNTNNVYGKLLTPETGGGRQNKLIKVHSLETRTGENPSSGTSRVAVSKSHSFGGYGSSQTPQSARILSRQGDLASSSWRISPSSSGYKTLSLRSTDSITPSPTGEAAPDPAPCPSPGPGASLLWAVTLTDASAVPRGAIIIHPQTGMPLTNADGSTYHYDPSRPPRLPTNTQTDNLQTQPRLADKKIDILGEKRRGRLEKQNSITAPDNQECSQDTVPEYTNTLKCCLECCQPNNEVKGAVAIQSGQSNTNVLPTPIANEHDASLDKATGPNAYYRNTNEVNYSEPGKKNSYVPYGESYEKNIVFDGQIPEMLPQKINCDNTAYYPLGPQDVSSFTENQFGGYQGQNQGENVVLQNPEAAMCCSEDDTHKAEPRQTHYHQDGATCQPLAIQLAGPGSYAAQVAEHCRLEQNVVQAYALTHQLQHQQQLQQVQLVPPQQMQPPVVQHYTHPPAPTHDKPSDSIQGQPSLVYGAYGTCGAPNCPMMDHSGGLMDHNRGLIGQSQGLVDHGRGLMDSHPTPPPHHPYPVYHEPGLLAQRYPGIQTHRQPTLLHHAYQYPTPWTTQWPLLAATPNIVNQNCQTPTPKPQTPPTVFVPQPDLTLSYQSNPGLVQYPGLIPYPPVNYAPLIQPHLIHTQPYICPSVYPQPYIDARVQIPPYAETQIYQANRNNNSGIRSYESFQSANSRNYREGTNVRSPKFHSRAGSMSGSSRTTPLGGQYTPPSHPGENFPQDERFTTYPVYRHGHTGAYCCNTNLPNQSQSDSQRNNESNSYQRQNSKGDQKGFERNETNTDAYDKRRAFRSNASRSQNSLSRQDSFEQSNGKDCIVHVQEKMSRMNIANEENVTKDVNKLNSNDAKPFVSNLSPNSQNFVPKNYVKTEQTTDVSNPQTIYTKNRVYTMPVPANLIMERDMHSLRDIEDSMRSSQQSQAYARNYVAPQNFGKCYNTDGAEPSNESRSQHSNEHCNVDMCQLKCESTNVTAKNCQKTDSVVSNMNVASNTPPNPNPNVNYQRYGVPRNFDTNYSDAVRKSYNDNVKNEFGEAKSVENDESANESKQFKNSGNETQPNSQLLKAISNMNSSNEAVTQNVIEVVTAAENNVLQTDSERVISSQSAIYARPVDTSTVQSVSIVTNYQNERTNSYERNFTSYNERSGANSITGLNYPGFHQNGGAERSFQPRNSASHSFVRRDGGFRFRFNSRNPGFRNPTPGAVQQLHHQMQLQYGRPFMFARQMYTGGWSRRSPSPISSNFQTSHASGPRYSGPRPVRPTQYQERYYNPRR